MTPRFDAIRGTLMLGTIALACGAALARTT
jgi:hypothetical protein